MNDIFEKKNLMRLSHSLTLYLKKIENHLKIAREFPLKYGPDVLAYFEDEKREATSLLTYIKNEINQTITCQPLTASNTWE